MKRPALLAAGLATIAIALVHVVALFIGPKALAYLDAPDLAEMMERGSPVPVIATGGVIVVMLTFAAYAFAGAGVLRPLPKLSLALAVIGAIFVVRGLGVAWFSYLLIVGSPDAIPREIGFSLVSLVVGLLYLSGRRALVKAHS